MLIVAHGNLLHHKRRGESDGDVKNIEVFGKDIIRKRYRTLYKLANSQMGRDFMLTVTQKRLYIKARICREKETRKSKRYGKVFVFGDMLGVCHVLYLTGTEMSVGIASCGLLKWEVH